MSKTVRWKDNNVLVFKPLHLRVLEVLSKTRKPTTSGEISIQLIRDGWPHHRDMVATVLNDLEAVKAAEHTEEGKIWWWKITRKGRTANRQKPASIAA
jgi:hypothetical protein